MPGRLRDRLRPEWVELWLYNPGWLMPYTSMPVPLSRTKKQFEDIFDGDARAQTIGMRDALMNYHQMMETVGITIYDPQASSSGTEGE
ncbi:MAG: hypothetical protein IH968_13980 [Gemmatimonadetes bacterium]|nr:hypothetical protein [Gemmatimonadota bacterium]